MLITNPSAGVLARSAASVRKGRAAAPADAAAGAFVATVPALWSGRALQAG